MDVLVKVIVKIMYNVKIKVVHLKQIKKNNYHLKRAITGHKPV